MIIKDIAEASYAEVADKTLLCELFHPEHYQGRVSSRYSIAHACLKPGSASLPHTLIRSSEVYYILEGTGRMHVGEESADLHSGQLVYIPPGKVQYIENTGEGELRFLALVDPSWTSDDEILGTVPPDRTVPDDPFLEEAIREAKAGLMEGGIPIGSLLVRNGTIIARGHNRRVQDENPMVHAEIDCLINAGRIGSYRDCTLYSTLMPCYLCAGAVVQFGIPEVIVGEAETFSGAEVFMRSHGVRVVVVNDQRCIEMMSSFIRDHPDLWNEDIGK